MIARTVVLLFLLHLGGPFGALGVGMVTTKITFTLLKEAP